MAPIGEAEVLLFIGEVLRENVNIEGSEHELGKYGHVDSNELRNVATMVNDLAVADDCSVATQDRYEIVIDPAFRGSPTRLGVVPELEDFQQGLTYSIGKPSLAFIIYASTLSEQPERNSPRTPFSRIPGQGLFTEWMERAIRTSGTNAIESVRQGSLLWTLQISSTRERPMASWRRLADAFLFHLSYNSGIAWVPQQWVTPVDMPVTRPRRPRRTRPNELDPPRRVYVSDLVHHYQLGMSAESPILEYLSYYHVLEHWFESIFEDDLIGQVQTLITGPAFSYRRRRDTQSLIRLISKAVQLRNEELVINEQLALKLTLAKYVDATKLIEELNRINPALLPYYASTEVGFAGGDKVELAGADLDKMLKSLGRRIYKTRNALVHSKDGPRSRFVPFSDDRQLQPEIPLLRSIAEQVIIATSEPQSA